MMWLVRIALGRPYTFLVMALLLPMLGAVALFGAPGRPGMATDIFPDIRIPVIAAVFSYTGLPPEEMSGRISSVFERSLSTVVNDVEHSESQSYPGVAVIKAFFQPGVDINLAMAQMTAFGSTSIRNMPPGIQPAFLLKYNASTVPVLQLALSSTQLPEAELFDFSNSFIRTQLSTVAGASMPYPFGGALRQIQVDLDPARLRALGLTPADVNVAIGNQNLIIPSGTQKIGETEYSVKLNASPFDFDELNDVPIRELDGSVTYVRDVAHVHDGHQPQTNVVRMDGKRAVLTSVQKTGSASTLDIIESIKERLPAVREQLPEGAAIVATGDQSVFVKAAITGVAIEGVIAAALTGLMILLFLGSWRSTLIIAISIPLSIIASILALHALGETINIMTLGGLALAVGILVDDATVTIENINRLLEEGADVDTAIIEGSRQIVTPAFVSTLSICIVFVPMFLLSGVARFLFVPMAEAVVFAMIASFILSRTLVPTLAKYWLRAHGADGSSGESKQGGALQRFQRRFESRFDAIRTKYREALTLAIQHRRVFLPVFLAATVLSLALVPFLGQDFFPAVDAGQIKLHFRGPTGLRVEETAALADRIEKRIRQVIPAGELDTIVDNIGLPASGINLVYGNSGTIGMNDGDILISLKRHHAPTAGYVRALRSELPDSFPGTQFAFLPADIVSQILNFGMPAPIDIQIVGGSPQNRELANRLLQDLRAIPGLVDLRIQQPANLPELRVHSDRSRAEQLGLTQRDLAGNMLIALSGSQQTSPTFWLNRQTGTSYPIVTQAPQYRLSSLQDLQNLPVSGGEDAQILGGLSTIDRGFGPAVVSKYDGQTVIDIFGSVQDRDLGSVGREIRKVIERYEGELPKGTKIVTRGQMQTMQGAYSSLLVGLVGAIVLVYLLIVVCFQSWTDPLVIIGALPAAIAGIAWMLFLTGTTLSVPALTGAIMCMGVATANSILMVSFARERLAAGATAVEAAIDAGYTRFRPVLMTSLAMIIGMTPMALSLGEGAEQNAPLGRAVIGGLLFATGATLFFVPTLFSLLHARRPEPQGVPQWAT